MKNLKFILIFLLSVFAETNAKLDHYNMAHILNIPVELSKQIIDRVEYIDQINTNHASYYSILSDVFLKKREYKIGCEIGIFTGGHAKSILANSNVEKLYCIDPYIAPLNTDSMITNGFEKNYWQACWDMIYYHAMDKVSEYRNRAQFIRLPADQGAITIEDHSLDFIFIDGDHSYAAVLSDCTNYYNKVRSGGIISGDDYQIHDVAQAIQDFFREKNLVINIYPGQKRFWWVEKP